MTSPTAILGETGAMGSSAGDLATVGLRPHQVLIVSAWCGLLSGPLEVGAIVLRKHTYDLDQCYRMSRHFVWLIPLTNLLLFLALGAILALGTLGFGRRGSRLTARLLCAMALLPAAWAAFPRIYAPAALILVLGIASRLVPFIERHPRGFRRGLALGFPPMTALILLLAASTWGADHLAEWRQWSSPRPPSGSPNLLLIVLDTVAASHLSLYGYDRPTSPTLEELAHRGIHFRRARATSSWTLPSHASFFTGRWPHELSTGWLTPLDATQPTLANYLGSRGYATAGFVANVNYCGADTGLGRGFAHYEDYVFPELSAFKMAALIARPLEGLRSIDLFLSRHVHLVPFRDVIRPFDAGSRKPADEVRREFLDWLSRRPQPDRPFFAFLNFYDAHYPYRIRAGGMHRFGAEPDNQREVDILENWRSIHKPALPPQEVAFARDSYDDCVADLDEQLGLLYDELECRGLLRQTWVIITSDHGESFGERSGMFGHGTSLYQTQLQVPLLILPPSGSPAPAKSVVTETVSLRDLPATAVDLLDLQPRAPFPGRSLARSWRSPAAEATPATPAAEPALSEVVLTDPRDPSPERVRQYRRVLVSLADGPWTYIRSQEDGREELYNLSNDARELHDLSRDAAMQGVLERMRRALDRMTDGPVTPERFRP
jgi:arylsulfatase A-like enzyme